MQQLNPYTYCANNPVMYVDPNGEWFFFDNLIIGFFKGVFRGGNPFKTAWRDGVNDLRVWGGLFNGNFRQILSRFTWELPQTLTGFISAQSNITFGDVEKVGYWGGATVLQNKGREWGAITMGPYIMGDRTIEADPKNELFQHEYGHYLQSQAAGPIYLWKYGLPSLYSAGKSWEHDYHPVEQDANRRSIEYFEDKYPGFVDNGYWNMTNNPIIGWDSNQPYSSQTNQDALDKAEMKAYSIEDLSLFPLSVITFSKPYFDWQGYPNNPTGSSSKTKEQPAFRPLPKPVLKPGKINY